MNDQVEPRRSGISIRITVEMVECPMLDGKNVELIPGRRLHEVFCENCGSLGVFDDMDTALASFADHDGCPVLGPPAPAPDRAELIELCDRGVVPVDRWHDRDSDAAQRQLGECRALLAAGCPFEVERDEFQRSAQRATWWVTIRRPDFGWVGVGPDDPSERGPSSWPSIRFYVPTAERLARAAGRDWY